MSEVDAEVREGSMKEYSKLGSLLGFETLPTRVRMRTSSGLILDGESSSGSLRFSSGFAFGSWSLATSFLPENSGLERRSW